MKKLFRDNGWYFIIFMATTGTLGLNLFPFLGGSQTPTNPMAAIGALISMPALISFILGPGILAYWKNLIHRRRILTWNIVGVTIGGLQV
jgi:hypothetical protein